MADEQGRWRIARYKDGRKNKTITWIQPKENNVAESKQNPFTISQSTFKGADTNSLMRVSTDGSLGDYKLPQSVLTVSEVIDPQVQGLLAAQFASVGLNFDISQMCMGKDNTKLLADVQKVAEIVSKNSELLPKFAVAFKKIFRGVKKKAKFDADMACKSMETQYGIDKAKAKVLMGMMGYASKRNKLQVKIEAKKKRLEEKNKAMVGLTNHQFGESQRYFQANMADLQEVATKRSDRQIAASKNQKAHSINREAWREKVSNNSVQK